MARFIILLFVIIFSVYLTEQAYFLQHKYIDNINKVASTWKAGVNFDPNTPEEDLRRLLGSKGVVRDVSKIKCQNKTHDHAYTPNMIIPTDFDSRLYWQRCTVIGEVRDQGKCGSSWAFSTTGAFADRLCIATNGEFNQLISAEELAFCCHSCGDGCGGGYLDYAWNHIQHHGVVTGGNYNTTDGCQPYKIPPSNFSADERNSYVTKSNDPKCSKTCYGDKSINFKKDHRKTRSSYKLTYAMMQRDIMVYGPIAASINIYDEFYNYKSGVYIQSENASYVGDHAVKLIGWGVEQGIDYWLGVNSWGYRWGDNGLFKIRRGTNECGVDNTTYAGVPVV